MSTYIKVDKTVNGYEVDTDNKPSSGGGATMLYAWVWEDGVIYADFDIAPDSVDAPGVAKLMFVSEGALEITDFYSWVESFEGYSKVTDTQFEILLGRDIFTYTRDATKDVEVWNAPPEVETTKQATIDVSTYDPSNKPVITPTVGKQSMEEVEVTLNNIPSGNNMLYCWRNEDLSISIYTNFDTAPVNGSNAKFLYIDWNSSAEDLFALEVHYCSNYTKVSDTEIICSNDRWSEPLTFTRTSQGDTSLWGER